MKANYFRTIFSVASAALLCAATLISSPLPTSALAAEKITGQDVGTKNCERIDTPGSSTFGKCESVCKDKEVTRDAVNNRWVCKASKAVVSRPLGQISSVSDKAQNPSANPTPKRQPFVRPKAGKAKKN